MKQVKGLMATVESSPIENPPIQSLNDQPDAPPDTPAVEQKPIHELTDKDMPDIETLGENSDYRGFLSPKVSESLRRHALRKLFSLPEFNLVDGLNDYDEDYSSFVALGDIVTYEMRDKLQQQTIKSIVFDDKQNEIKQDLVQESVAESVLEISATSADDDAATNESSTMNNIEKSATIANNIDTINDEESNINEPLKS